MPESKASTDPVDLQPIEQAMKVHSSFYSHIFYLTTGMCIFFAGMQIGEQKAQPDLTHDAVHRVDTSEVMPAYYIDGQKIPEFSARPAVLPDIEVIYTGA